jgi:hypothetical protein
MLPKNSPPIHRLTTHYPLRKSPANKGRNMRAIAQTTPLLTKTKPLVGASLTPRHLTLDLRPLRVRRGSQPARQNHPSGTPTVHFFNLDAQLPNTHFRHATIHFGPKSHAQKFHPKRPVFSENKGKTVLPMAIKNVKNPLRPNRTKNYQTPQNTVRNGPHGPKVLNNSPTTIPSRSRKLRHLKTPHCAKIQPENAQQFMQEKSSIQRSGVGTLQPENQTW